MPDPRPPTAPEEFHVLAKPTGPICNLDCEYCFFLSKESLYPGDRFRMSDELLETYVRQLFESHASAPEVTVAWQGGEPTLMGVEFFRRALELTERYRRPGQQVQHTIQTNGTLLTDAWCELLAEHRFLVGISIDGPPELHDRYRVDKRGNPSSERVLRGLELLKQARRGVQRLVHGERGEPGPSPRGLPLLPRRARRQVHPVHPHRGARQRHRIPGGRPGHRTLRRPGSVGQVPRHRVRRVAPPRRGHRVRLSFRRGARLLGGRAPALCVFAETCGNAVALEHNGDLYSCDHFVEPGYLLGNIFETHMVELMASPQQRAFGEAKRDTLPRYCLECAVRFACQGECPKNRFTRTPDGEPGLNYLCAGYKEFFGHIDGPMAAHGRPAAPRSLRRRGHGDPGPGRAQRPVPVPEWPQGQGLSPKDLTLQRALYQTKRGRTR